MHWLRSHRYTIALIGTAIIVTVVGMLAKNNEATLSESGDIKNVAVEYPYYVPPTNVWTAPASNAQANPQNIESNASNSAPPLAIFGQKPKSGTLESPEIQPPEIPLILKNTINVTSPSPTQGSTAEGAYQLFFRTLSSLISPVDTRTPVQKALHRYGNEAGALIRNFENAHGNNTLILRSFFDSRANPARPAPPPDVADAYAKMMAFLGPAPAPASKDAAVAQVQAVADNYARLGSAIESIRNVPPEAKTANEKLARCYANVANGLSKLTKTGNDAQLLEAVNAYNVSAGECVQNYVALVDIFSMYGVRFGANDSGAMFSFNAGGGL